MTHRNTKRAERASRTIHAYDAIRIRATVARPFHATRCHYLEDLTELLTDLAHLYGTSAFRRAARAALATLEPADYDARHGVRSDGYPPSDQDPSTGTEYGEVA